MIIVFFGPPGSGKGTQAQVLSKTMDFVHLSTGEMLRQEIQAKGKLSSIISEKIDNGELVNDDIILQLISDIVKKNANRNIIFDGFPRTLNQAIAFDSLLGVENLKIDIFFDFNIEPDILVERIKGRYTCLHCGTVYHTANKAPKKKDVCDQCGSNQFNRRQDDTADLLEKRVKIYNEDTFPLKNYYEKKGISNVINASLAPDEVSKFIKAALTQAG